MRNFNNNNAFRSSNNSVKGFNHNGTLHNVPVSELNPEDYNRVETKACFEVNHTSGRKAVIGIDLTEFVEKESGKLSHGFVRFQRLTKEVLAFSTFKELLEVTPIGQRIMADSAVLYARQCEGTVEGERSFYTKVLPNNQGDGHIIAICKRTRKSSFTQVDEPTMQYLVVRERDQGVTFPRVLYLNNILPIVSTEFPDEIPYDEGTQFIEMEVKDQNQK